ncbi:MAG: bifunctional diguanylate cyclase/phosphodiesterase [Psychromonas sp.]|nr:bifunctional diguanylate cyclase/phosphodiesterase [Psychromonas sp.]
MVTEIKLSAIKSAFIDKLTVLVLVHLLSIMLIFILFRGIANSEKKKKKELEFQANHDYLTQLWNRYYFDRYVANIDRNSVFSLIYLNINHFKNVNDNYGHGAGDQLLKQIAVRISTIAHKDDLVIRSSSAEFILICFHQTERQTSETCNQLLSSYHKPFLLEGSEITLSASIGISCYPKDSSNPEDIIRNADLAINSAKKEINKAVFFNQSLLNEHLYLRNVEQELKKAIDNQELYMVYQPQVSFDGSIIGVEALIRWENKKLGFMPPDKFIPIAESIGMMDEIGTFVIERSLSDMMSLHTTTGVKNSLSINVSVKQFKNPDFFEDLMALVRESNFPSELLILEITESVLIDDIDAMQNLMVKIKAQNIRISLDDFGTGYSSLSILNNLPIDELKIDKSFIDNVNSNEETRTMISSMITIAKSKNMKTVAEGVETKEMLLALQVLECDIYQGYYFSKPIDKNQLEQFTNDNNR